jgi:transposase
MFAVIVVLYLALRSYDMLKKFNPTQINHNNLVDSNMHPVSSAQLNHILSLLDSGHSAHHISSLTGLHHTTISRLQRKHHPYQQRVAAGRPPKLSEADTRYAQHLITSRKAENASQITQILQEITNQSLTSQTTRNHLKKAGLKAVVKAKKPLLTKRHRKERLDFALAHQHWTVEDWKTVVWSDETKINRLGSDGRIWAWKKAGEGLSDRLVKETKKFGGGSLMMWGCMLWEGVGYACKIDGKMDGELYTKILQDELQDSLAHYGKDPSSITFQQDNDPKHKSKIATNWFEDHGFKVLPWPAQSPDLNPIEHLWDHLKRKLGEYERVPGGILELWERVQVEWEKIEPEVCQNLIESMPRRVAAVVKANGGHTKY